MDLKGACDTAPIDGGMKVAEKYAFLCDHPSDINEHLPMLASFASECDSCIELGCRGVVSTWAFAHGLLEGDKSNRLPQIIKHKFLFVNDIEECDLCELQEALASTNVKLDCEWCNDLELSLSRTFDLTFIDTWHVEGQLSRELTKFAPRTNKYIIMHDTTIDGKYSESTRYYVTEGGATLGARGEDPDIFECLMQGGWPLVEAFAQDHNRVLRMLQRAVQVHKNASAEAAKVMFNVEEVLGGLEKAVSKFLETEEGKCWERYITCTYNNGLLVLRRI